MTGILYIVSTPIGNLADITFRAIEVLKSVDIILAEDTRVTKKLLSHYQIKTPLLSYHHHSSDSKKLQILNKLISGQNLALVTDAGTPGISDPGNELIDFIYRNSQYQHASRLAAPKGPTKERGPDIGKLHITPIPGPSALTAAASISGLNLSQFTFLGYFPKKKKTKFIKLLIANQWPSIYFDSPYRVVKNLEFLYQQIGDREVMIARELTKLHETTYRGTISQVIKQLQNKTVKGEIVVIISNKTIYPER